VAKTAPHAPQALASQSCKAPRLSCRAHFCGHRAQRLPHNHSAGTQFLNCFGLLMDMKPQLQPHPPPQQPPPPPVNPPDAFEEEPSPAPFAELKTES